MFWNNRIKLKLGLPAEVGLTNRPFSTSVLSKIKVSVKLPKLILRGASMPKIIIQTCPKLQLFYPIFQQTLLMVWQHIKQVLRTQNHPSLNADPLPKEVFAFKSKIY